MIDLNTQAKNTWCPGCTNFLILSAFKNVLNELFSTGLNKDNVVMTAGIGCHGKIADYVNINSFISLHGREVATATGIKLANPKLTVVAFAGDGDAYAEGIEHLVHAAKRNSNITLLVHNNQVFGLTTGQVTPTSVKGYKGRSTPFGSVEEPLNPLSVLLSSGATFVARTYAGNLQEMQVIMKKAIQHKGFSVVDILQPCISFKDTREYFKERVCELEKNYPTDKLDMALVEVRSNGDKIPCGIFYQVQKPIFEDSF